MSENCTANDCSSCASQAGCSERGSKSAIQPEAPNVLSQVRRVIGVVSGKGGVGKSLTTGLLAVGTQRAGHRAAILDADITGPSVPQMFGIKDKAVANEAGIFPAVTDSGIQVISVNMMLEDEKQPVIWRGPVLAGAVKQFWTDVIWHDVDVMYVDLPPGTGDVPLTVFQSLPIDGIVLVTTPQELVSTIVAKALHMAQMMDVPILSIVENMAYAVCPHCGEKIPVFGKSNELQLELDAGISVGDTVPILPELTALCDEGRIEEAPTGLLQETLRAAMIAPRKDFKS
ncbi:MAG: Mrp/NBP35 family ATP-binding protein [Clostridia bacterium]|nr:Mrp/NBP35 family ATP-binding protein [Clostridia bacterium]